MYTLGNMKKCKVGLFMCQGLLLPHLLLEMIAERVIVGHGPHAVLDAGDDVQQADLEDLVLGPTDGGGVGLRHELVHHLHVVEHAALGHLGFHLVNVVKSHSINLHA